MKNLLGLVFILFFVGGCHKEQGPPVYTMGFAPSENADTVTTNGKILSDVLTRKTGINLKTYVAADYTALIEAMRGGNVPFAWLPPFALVLAEKRAGAKVLLKCVRNGKAYFYAAIIVRSDKPYKKLADLRGKTIAWVDPASSSGYVVPRASLVNDGIDPDTFFKKQVFAGGHDTVVLGVINGSVDAGATFTNEKTAETGGWTMLSTSRPEFKSKIRAVYVSQQVPNDTFATTDKFAREHPDVVNKITEAIKNLHLSSDGKKALYDLYRIDSMIPATSEEFEPLRKAASQIKVDVRKTP